MSRELRSDGHEGVSQDNLSSLYTKSYRLNLSDPGLLRVIDGTVIVPAAWRDEDDEDDEFECNT